MSASSSSTLAQTAPATRTIAALSSTGIDINAGGAPSGNWVADTDYSGGSVWSTSHAISTGSVSNPAPQTVYQTQRFASNLTYTVRNLTAYGSYNVRLHFAESYFTSAGSRVFNVKINGSQVLTNFDILSAAGGSNIAVAKSFSTNADASGNITIQLAATVNNASIGGIEVTSGSGAAATPAPTTPSTTFRGVVTGSLSGWDSWRGVSPQIVGVYNNSGGSRWQDLDDTVWLLSTYPAKTPMVWSLATYPTSSNLAAVAAGAGNGYYATWASEILARATPAPDGNYYIRPNWEVPGPWFSWGVQCAASPSNCIAAYRNIASAFHAASPKFKMVWDTISVFGNNTNNSIYYPGDAYVDVLSQDIYLDTRGNAPSVVWSYALIRPNGLNWMQSFAAAHNKRVAMAEWGVNSDTAGPLIQDIHSWLAANNAAYADYFDEGGTQLSNYQYPTSGGVFKTYF